MVVCLSASIQAHSNKIGSNASGLDRGEERTRSVNNGRKLKIDGDMKNLCAWLCRVYEWKSF